MSEYTEVQPSGKTVSSTAAMQLFVEQQTSAMLVAQKAAQKAVKKKNSKEQQVTAAASADGQADDGAEGPAEAAGEEDGDDSAPAPAKLTAEFLTKLVSQTASVFAHDLISHLDNNTIDIKAALQVLSEKIELELQQSGLDLNKALNSLRLYNECVRALAQHMFGCTAEVRKVAGTLKEVSATLSQTNEVISKLASGEERAKEQHDTLVFSLGELTAAVKELVQQNRDCQYNPLPVVRLQPVHDPADDEIRHIIDGDVGMVGEGTLGGVAQHDGATVLRPVFLQTPNSNWDNIFGREVAAPTSATQRQLHSATVAQEHSSRTSAKKTSRRLQYDSYQSDGTPVKVTVQQTLTETVTVRSPKKRQLLSYRTPSGEVVEQNGGGYMMCCRSETLVYSSLVSKHCSSSSLTQVEKKNSRLVGDRIFSCLNDYWRQLLSELDARHRPMVLESPLTVRAPVGPEVAGSKSNQLSQMQPRPFCWLCSEIAVQMFFLDDDVLVRAMKFAVSKLRDVVKDHKKKARNSNSFQRKINDVDEIDEDAMPVEKVAQPSRGKAASATKIGTKKTPVVPVEHKTARTGSGGGKKKRPSPNGQVTVAERDKALALLTSDSD